MIVKFMAFSLVGVIGTLAHYSILYALVEFYSFNPVWASGCGALAGLIVNYVLNYSLTFKSQQSHVQTFPKFALIASLGLCLNLALMAFLTPHLYYLYAQVVTTMVVLIWNFFANSFWTFQMDISGNTVDDKPISMIQKIFSGFGLLAIILAIRVPTLGLYPLYDPSESRYAEMGRKMLETGNWVTPLIDYGVPFWGKPPLTVWMTASSLWMGGVNDFSARLPSLLLSLGVAWIIFHLARVQRGQANAWNAVIILASSVLFFVMSGAVEMDICMNFGITLALASFWLALREGKSFWAYLFFIGLSIGVMAKGPIAIVLPGISIGLWTAISNEWTRVWQRLPWFKGTLLMLCISVPWFLIAEHKTPGFLEYFFIGEHWKRFTESGWTGDLYGNGHAHPRGTIWVYWLGAAFPWSLIFLKIVITTLMKKKPVELLQSNVGWRLYCLLWMTSPLLFFTFSANIIWTYPLPGLAGFALLLSDLLKPSKYRWAFALCVPLSFLGLVIAYQFPNMDFFRSQKALVAAYQQASRPDERLIYFKERPYSAQFYLQGKALLLTEIAALQDSLTDPSHDFYVLKKDLVSSLPEAVKLRLEPVKSYRGFELFHDSGVERR
ncbi:MAG: phospholipid carrier-dependent glycosyltransferase [Methylobacter sp.]|nr:phospholipid carrier-dependent glycosyltransferase [Methylobacter sp.]